MDEMTLTLSSPINEEQFEAITDVDFDNTDRIWFHTKHGKDVEFVKRKKGKWIDAELKRFDGSTFYYIKCDQCGYERADCNHGLDTRFCPACGAKMEEDHVSN